MFMVMLFRSKASWSHFGAMLGPFGGHVGAILGPWCGLLGAILEYFVDYTSQQGFGKANVSDFFEVFGSILAI